MCEWLHWLQNGSCFPGCVRRGRRAWAQPRTFPAAQLSLRLWEVMANCTRLFTQLLLFLSLNTLAERWKYRCSKESPAELRDQALLPPFPGLSLTLPTALVQRQRWHLRARIHHLPHNSPARVQAAGQGILMLPSGKQFQGQGQLTSTCHQPVTANPEFTPGSW